MTSQRIKAFVALVLMVAALAAAQAWRPTAHLADTRAKVELETMFPKAFGDWRVDDRMPVQLVSPDTQALLNKIYNQTLSRTYVNGKGERIMLSVAYGGDQSDGTRAHRPEVCYPAQGFQLLSSATGTLETGAGALRVRRLVARLGGRVEPITYWMVIGEQTTVSGTETKLAQLRYGLRGQIPDGFLVRVSSIDAVAAAAWAAQDRFIAQLAAGLTADNRARLIGVVGRA